MEGFAREAHEVSRHIYLKFLTHRWAKKVIFAAERTRGNLLTIQGLADFGVYACITARPNQRERRVVGRVIGGRISRGVTRRIRHQGDLAIRANRKALAIFCAAERTVHGGEEATTGKGCR